jgi:hypothetical protein
MIREVLSFRLFVVLLMVLFGLVVYVAAASLMPATIVVQWETANEVNTAGFNVYRSQSAQGPYVKINSQLLPASSDPLAGSKYRYEDASVSPGQTYYYNVEDVEYSGASTKHGPLVISAPSTLDAIYLALLIVMLTIGALILVAARTRGAHH